MIDDHELASKVARSAGDLLVGLRGEVRAGHLVAEALRDTGDAESHEHLVEELATHRPGDLVLSEEAADELRRLDALRVWIIDPLDGTREYGEMDRVDWAVHVALWEQGLGLAAGAVALPGRQLVFGTGPLAPPAPTGPVPARPRLLVSRTRPPSFAVALADALGADLVPLGSAGAKAMAVVLGEADIYAHAGGQWEWDNAAPAVVARAAGLHVSRLDGTEPIYNQPKPWLPDVLICRPELADRVLDAAAPLLDAG